MSFPLPRLQDLPPETELLLCCARTHLDGEKAERIKTLLRGKIDWPSLRGLSLRHGLTPLLYRSLKTVGPEAVPEAVLEGFRDDFLTNAGRAFRLAEELVGLLKRFEEHGIPVIPYKGPVMAASLYGDVTLRSFVDLDILVQKRDILRAKDLLVSAGYQWASDLTDAQKKAYLRLDSGGYTFRRNDGRIVVEIDRDITTLREFPFFLDLEPFWERVEWVSFEGRRVRTFSPEDLLLILCVHGAKHRWEQLNWACDLAELLRVRQEMDWKELLESADSLGCRRILLLGLVLAQSLFGACLPAAVLDRVGRDALVKGLAATLIDRLFGVENGADRPFGLSLFYLRASERFRDRAAYCARLIFTPTVGDRRSLPLPRSISFLYCLLHPIALTAKYGLGLFGRLKST